MYGSSTGDDHSAMRDLASIDDRITRETILDCLLNTPQPLPVDVLAARTDAPEGTVEVHLDALVTDGIVTATVDGRYTAQWNDLPIEEPDEAAATPEVFLLEARDKEYREWFGVDDPYEAAQPRDADAEIAIAALDQWFGVRKRLHRLADTEIA